MSNSSKGDLISLSCDEPIQILDSRVIGPLKSSEQITFLVELRQRVCGAENQPVDHSLPPLERLYLSTEEAFAHYGPDMTDFALLKQFADEAHLTIDGILEPSALVRLSGQATDVAKAFAVEMIELEHPDGQYFSYTGSIHIPDYLSDIVLSIAGLDSRPRANSLNRPSMVDDERSLLSVSEVKSYYQFPFGLGKGQTIGVLEFGGGIRTQDLDKFFEKRGAPPKVVPIEIAPGKNDPSCEGTGEVMLDIEIIGAAAPNAVQRVYFAENTDMGFLQALRKAIADECNVISISWGSAEKTWAAKNMDAFDKLAELAASMGITVCASTGDDGSNDEEDGDGYSHVDFPASSPHVLAVGGTKIRFVGKDFYAENVWNDGSDRATGGGISSHFPIPEWQKNLELPKSKNKNPAPGRGIPDVAAHASDYIVYYHDHENKLVKSDGGTSASAPLWAALISIINQEINGNVGLPHPLIYKYPKAFQDIQIGNNGAYNAGIGWDACTGWGSPSGRKLTHLFRDGKLSQYQIASGTIPVRNNHSNPLYSIPYGEAFGSPPIVILTVNGKSSGDIVSLESAWPSIFTFRYSGSGPNVSVSWLAIAPW